MNYSKLETALKTVMPVVYKVQAPEEDASGEPLRRFIVWTPTGSRPVYAEGAPFAAIGLAIVTVATQTEDDTLPAQVREALARARIPMGVETQTYDDEQMTYFTDIPVEVM